MTGHQNDDTSGGGAGGGRGGGAGSGSTSSAEEELDEGWEQPPGAQLSGAELALLKEAMKETKERMNKAASSDGTEGHRPQDIGVGHRVKRGPDWIWVSQWRGGVV